MERWHIQKLDGYTDGKPSWRKVGWASTKEEALFTVETLRLGGSYSTYRVRKARARTQVYD